jgi:hypothetical protein
MSDWPVSQSPTRQHDNTHNYRRNTTGPRQDVPVTIYTARRPVKTVNEEIISVFENAVAVAHNASFGAVGGDAAVVGTKLSIDGLDGLTHFRAVTALQFGQIL